MSKVYVLFVKKFPKGNGDAYTYAPDYEIHYEPVKGKVAELNVDECVDAYRCTLAQDGSYLKCELIRISNINGKALEEHTESFIMERAGH